MHFHDLSWEYLDPQIWSNLACSIGIPLRIDEYILHEDFDHYAWILVDLDLGAYLLETIALESEGTV